MVIANSRRAQESLRTLEELAKVPGTVPGDPDTFKHARFSLSSIEQNLLSRLLLREKLKRLHGLYAIIDTEVLKGRSHLEAARQIKDGDAESYSSGIK